MDNIEKDKQIMKTLELINFVDFSDENNYQSIFEHYECLNWDKTKTIDDIVEIKKHIIYAVLNYLYTGEWGIGTKKKDPQWLELTDDSRKAFGLAVFKEKVKNSDIKLIGLELSTNINIEDEETYLINYLSSTWKDVFEAHDKYISDLIEKNEPIDSIIVYEAPPFPKDGKLNYVLLDNTTGSYSDAIKNAFPESDSLKEKLVENGVLFFDLLMLPIPLSSTIRREWSTKEEFKINGKQLPVVLFEMNLKHYLINLYFTGIDCSADIKIAIGTPHLTALGIYNYYCKHDLIINEINFTNIKKSLIDRNELKNKLELMSYVVPLFKSCFVNASNNPDGILLQHALRKETE